MNVIDLYTDAMTPRQLALKAKHGTPSEFARACYAAVPGFISMDEAAAAIAKYQTEWCSDSNANG